MKFKEMAYTRLAKENEKKLFAQVTEEFRQAASYEEAKAAFLKEQGLERRLDTMITLASIRHSIDTRDPFYEAEEDYWNQTKPELTEYLQGFTRAMLESPFRADLEKEYGKLYFLNAEIELKTFSPEIIPLLQEEADLVTEYMKIIASAQIAFEDGTYTLSQLTPFKTGTDDARREAAWKAEGAWYKEKQPELDRIYDRIVRLRDGMGKALGYEGYTTLGYYRMGRNCYTKEDIEKFRAAVRKYLVPLADRIYRAQAKRTGLPYPLSYSDAVLVFRSGNPRPQGTAEDILSAGRAFYDALSPETSAFFRMMTDNDLLDVLSTEGKETGGYCTGIPDYKMPFIFANFNGTQGDVEVVTHEAGHAFAYYMNADRIPLTTCWPSMESCEVHSMSMEFFAWPWAEGFFGKDTEKYRYSHLGHALKFIPYGTLVDHFQHAVYEKPDMTPAERHAVWKELQQTYMPWIRLDGGIPFYGEGMAWQRQHHIYTHPFYYIDYCLAQTVSLEFWARSQNDLAGAWQTYMTYTKMGGSETFTDLLAKAGLSSPFEEDTLRRASEAAAAWLTAHPAV